MRYAAITSFYQNIGMLMEDIITALVVWPAWAKDRTLALADLNERLVLSEGPARKNDSKAYRNEAANYLTTKGAKRVRVNPALYLASVFDLTNEDILKWLGIPWKTHPSVRMVPRSAFDAWHRLPDLVEILRAFTLGEGNELVVPCYNKLKHGPQVVIASIRDALLARGDKNAHILPDERYVRLLFQGAKTENGTERLVAPFLFHEPYCVNAHFFLRLLPLAVTYSRLAGWLLCTQFTKSGPAFADKQIRELLRECAKWTSQVEWGGGEDMSDILKMAARPK